MHLNYTHIKPTITTNKWFTAFESMLNGRLLRFASIIMIYCFINRYRFLTAHPIAEPMLFSYCFESTVMHPINTPVQGPTFRMQMNIFYLLPSLYRSRTIAMRRAKMQPHYPADRAPCKTVSLVRGRREPRAAHVNMRCGRSTCNLISFWYLSIGERMQCDIIALHHVL